MKNLFTRVLLIGLLLLTAATVKAETKPDLAIYTTTVKIVSTGMTWNYDTLQLCSAAHVAIPTLTFYSVDFQNPGPGVYWLHFYGADASGKGANIYFHLELVGEWYELPPNGIANGGGAWSCVGNCTMVGGDTAGECENVSTTVMVLCGCSGNSLDCRFHQYPISTCEVLWQALQQMPPQGQ